MHPSLTDPIDALEPIGLTELEAAAGLLDRVDRKYVVGVDQLSEALAGPEGAYRVLEIDGLREFAYRSTYFDTVALTTYRHHVQQRRRRYKVRAREYVDAGLCTFEVKLKGAGGRTVKRRMGYDPALAGRISADAAAFLAESVIREYGHAPPEGMLPTLTMRFRRVTLVAAERGERVTIDMGLTFRGPDGAVGRMAGDRAIVESKSADGAAAIDRLLRRAGLRPEPACSKYCLGLALVQPAIRANAFRPLLRRHFSMDGAGPEDRAAAYAS